MSCKNQLYFGDNHGVLREHVQSETVDLIYLDPPFNSEATYNVLFAENSGEKSAAQLTAFEDTWHWGAESEEFFRDIVFQGGKLAELMSALRSFLGRNDMMAYLVMMAIRLKELYRVLKPAGSLYLHCDETASHYLKLLMDAVFGNRCFKNEIIWQRTNAHNTAGQYGRIHDIIFFYAKGPKYTWNEITTEFSPAQLKRYKKDADGRLYTGQDLTAPRPNSDSGKFDWRGTIPPENRGWGYELEQLEEWWARGLILTKKDGTPRMDGLKVYLDEKEGKYIQDLWMDIPRIPNTSAERLGYPTQKPEILLDRILRQSSKEGDLVLDPFCGCGTTIAVAERLKRRWIGIDITHLAITLMKHRLANAFGDELSPYQIEGIPTDISGARALAGEDRYKFEWWGLGLVDARPAQNKKKGADGGFDGVIYFFDDESGKPKKIVVQVKSGHVTRNQIGDLNHVRERENAEIAVFITLEVPTKPMQVEAVSAGFYQPRHFPGFQAPRIQICTVAGLLGGQKIEYPRVAPSETFKRAVRQKKEPAPRQTFLL